jgi:predicted MFS family arabinose efflux permease
VTPSFLRLGLPFLAGYFVSYVYRSANAILGPELAREFGLDAAALGLLTGVYFLAFALFQLPLGLLLDRYGPRRVNATLLALAAAGALAFTLARSPAELVAARAAIGIGVSAGLMASLAAFALWLPAGRLATMNGVAFASGMLGAIAATVPLELALRAFGWRAAFAALIALNVVVCLLLWFVVPERRPAQHPPALRAQLAGFVAIGRDPAFWRIALCVGASQAAAVSLATLWVATWLRDVAGYTQAEVARALLLFSLAMIAGFLGFGRAADRLARRGADPLALLAAGVAVASVCLALLALGVRSGALVLWCVFFGSTTSVTLAYAIYTRRHPKEMAGRANTALNVVVFAGMFAGQWAVGALLDRWPQTATGYAPEAYGWALAALWAVQLAGLAWLWRGRALLR